MRKGLTACLVLLVLSFASLSAADSTDTALQEQWAAMDVAQRAAAPIRARALHSTVRWSAALRAAKRERMDAPQASGDTQRLLRYAAPVALSKRVQDVDVLERAHAEKEAFASLLVNRGRASVAAALRAADQL